MPTRATDILTASYIDIGVLDAEESMTPSMAQQGLRRMNNMITGWQIQSGTVPAVVRTLFPLVDGKATYYIGLGGDFDVPRPAVNIPGAGLLMQGLDSAVSVTSITRSSYVGTVTQAAHGYAIGDQVLIAGAAQITYNGLQTVQSVPTANTWTFTVQGLPTTPATGTITAAAISGEPTEIRREIITVDGFQGLSIKNLPNSLFTNVYYSPTYPFGTIILWPVPDTTVNQLVLYLDTVFTGFADLLTQYDWPNLPGYAEAIQYQLNKRLAPAFHQDLSPDLVRMANETFGIIKRGNSRIVDVPTDATILTFRGGYNIETDQQGN